MKIKLFALALPSFLIISCNKDFTDCKKFIGTWYGKCNTQENSNLKCETCKTLEINIKDDECFISANELPTFGSSCGTNSQIYNPDQIDCENGKLQIGDNKSEITISEDHKKIYFQGEEYFNEEEALPTSVESAIILKKQMDAQGKGNIKINQLIKTNGTEREYNGQKTYTMEWQATLKFDKECWSSNINGFAGGFYSEQFIFSENQKDVYMEAFISKYKHYEKGSQMTLNGKHDFKKTENGWKAQGQIVKRNKQNIELLKSEYEKTAKEKTKQDSIEAVEVAAKRKMDSLFDAASTNIGNTGTNSDYFSGKWEDSGCHVKIRKQGTDYYIEYNFEADAINSGKFQLANSSLFGKTANQFYPNNFTNEIFELSSDKKELMFSYNDGRNKLVLHKVNKFSYE